MVEKFKKLIDVKSIVTLVLAAVFAYFWRWLVRLPAEQFITIFTVIISFYFGTQVTKKVEL